MTMNQIEERLANHPSKASGRRRWSFMKILRSFDAPTQASAMQATPEQVDASFWSFLEFGVVMVAAPEAKAE